METATMEMVTMEMVAMEMVTMEMVTMEMVTMETVTMEMATMEIVTMEMMGGREPLEGRANAKPTVPVYLLTLQYAPDIRNTLQVNTPVATEACLAVELASQQPTRTFKGKCPAQSGSFSQTTTLWWSAVLHIRNMAPPQWWCQKRPG
ncbi:hypothetical protein Bbelb_383320 [Branchiostoma belcheri]|nr:hypothetical protein Bbelb_383320 [Branchiostoma belcheri]